MEKLKENNALTKLKEDLNKELNVNKEEEEVKFEQYDEVLTAFKIKKKKKNITDGTVQSTFYLQKEQKNYIDKMAKQTGYTKSEFLQYIISYAMQTLEIE